MEVKTTTKNERIHSISLNQILKSIETESLICSIMTSKIDLGLSVFDLKENIALKINAVYKHKLNEKVTISIGDKWLEFTNKYDYLTAENSMNYYNAIDVPKIDPICIDPKVSNVKFNINLETTQKIDILHVRNTCLYLPS